MSQPRRTASQRREQEKRRSVLAGITRDLVLFSTGLLLVIYEAVIRREPPRESLIVLYGGMMGLPAILRADIFKRKHGE